MKLVEITDQKIWDGFHTSQPWSQFAQSWTWGEFCRAFVKDVKRFAVTSDDGEWLAALQMEFRAKPIVGGFWFAPRGPILVVSDGDQQQKVMTFLCEQLKSQLAGSSTLFWRWEPVVFSREDPSTPLRSAQDDTAMTDKGFIRSKAANPASTILIDLHQTEEQLLAAMHPKTRYNIRVAMRHGVTVREGQASDLPMFLDLMDETAKRDGFSQHDRGYLQSMYERLSQTGTARLRLAESDGRILAATFEMHFGDTVTYLHGASSSTERQRMAPFLLHWEAIRSAKADGHRWYDLWGANPIDTSSFYYKPSWEGITRFKRGFGGQQIDLVGTWDRPMKSFLYNLVKWQQRLRG